MPREINNHFVYGFEKKVIGHRGYLDLRRSVYNLELLTVDDRRDFLRVLGMCWASVREPHGNTTRINMSGERSCNIIYDIIPSSDRATREAGRKSPEVSIKDPSFAYYFYSDLPPSLGKVQSGWLLEGILTKAIDDNLWLDDKGKTKRYSLVAEPGKLYTLEQRKVLFKTRNQDISDRVQFHLTAPHQHPMPWLPYDKGLSRGTWIPRPLDAGIQNYIIDPELREKVAEFYQFPYNVHDEALREIVILTRRHVYEIAALKGWITIYEDRELRGLLEHIRKESRRNERELDRLDEELRSVMAEPQEKLARLDSFDDIGERKKLELKLKRLQTAYKKRRLAIEVEMKKIQKRQTELEEALDSAPKKKGWRQWSKFDPSYGKRQYDTYRH